MIINRHGTDMKPVLLTACVIMASVVFGCTLNGFVSSEGQLSPYERLPRWVSLPPGYSTKDVTVTVTFYSRPTPINSQPAQVVVRGPDAKHRVLMDMTGSYRWHPITEEEARARGDHRFYPKYIIVTIAGASEVIEQRAYDRFLHILDISDNLSPSSNSVTP